MAQRAGDIVTRSGQVHVYQPLPARIQPGYWPAGELREGEIRTGKWQQLAPAISQTCVVFPDQSPTVKAQDGGYAWAAAALSPWAVPAIFLPIIVLFQSPENILWMLVVFGFLYGIPYGVNATYMTESFEAKFRGSAVGGAYNIGRLGAAIAPAAIGFLASHGSIGIGFLVMGAAYFICGVIPALFIRDKQFDPQKQ